MSHHETSLFFYDLTKFFIVFCMTGVLLPELKCTLEEIFLYFFEKITDMGSNGFQLN